MGISIREFQTAMETIGATPIAGQIGSRHSVPVPAFDVKGVLLKHSGSYYVVHRVTSAPDQQKELPNDVMNKAMAAVGEKHLGGANFWWGETHSVEGIITLATMLEGTYSKELVAQKVDETYNKIVLDGRQLIQDDIKSLYATPAHSPKMQELRDLVAEYHNVVNPFSNSDFDTNNPSEFLKKVNFDLNYGETGDWVRLKIADNYSSAEHGRDEKGWVYMTLICNDPKIKAKGGNTSMGHYFNNGFDKHPVDEVVRLSYTTSDDFSERPDDIDLRISMKTGLAWKTYQEKQAAPATDEQIETMMTHLKRSIDRTKNLVAEIALSKEIAPSRDEHIVAKQGGLNGIGAIAAKTKECKKIVKDFFGQQKDVLIVTSELNDAIKRVQSFEIKNSNLKDLVIEKDVSEIKASLDCPNLGTIKGENILKTGDHNFGVPVNDTEKIRAVIKNENGFFVLRSGADKLCANTPMIVHVSSCFNGEDYSRRDMFDLTHQVALHKEANPHVALPNSQYLTDLQKLSDMIVVGKNKQTELPKEVKIDCGRVL